MITHKNRHWLGMGLALVAGGIAPGVRADTLPFVPTFTIGSTALENDSVQQNADGSFRLAGTQQGGSFNGGAVWDLQWDVTVKQDPFIVGSLTLTNLTSTTRNFSLSLSLPITPAFSPSLYGGSISATLLDLNGDLSATLAPSLVSPAIYRGTIDGVTVLSLFGASVTCTASNPGCSASQTFDDGLPGPTLPGPGVVSNIGTLLNFTLSPGDRVVFNTNFTVEPLTTVPLPAAAPLLLLGFGSLAAARGRRRRKGHSS